MNAPPETICTKVLRFGFLIGALLLCFGARGNNAGIPFPLPFPSGPKGRLIVWGAGNSGLSQPAHLTNIVAISVGASGGTTYAFRDDGTVVRWGGFDPAIPLGISNLVHVEAGENYRIGLASSGIPYFWGSPDAIGSFTFHDQLIDVAAGRTFAIGLTASNTVVNLSNRRLRLQGETNVKSIAAGDWHAVALLQDGTIHLDNLDSGIPDAPLGLRDVASIATGLTHVLALHSNGTITAWGHNESGQANVPLGASNVIAVAAGGNHSLLLLSNGTVKAWGAITDVPEGLTNIVAIAAGYHHNAAIQAGPFFTETPPNIRTTIHSKVELRVSASSPGGQITYEWYRNGNRIGGQSNSIFTIETLNSNYTGLYKVRASSDGFSIDTEFRVSINEIFEVETPAEVWVKTGQDGIFEAAALADSGLTYQWYHEDRLLRGETNSSLVVREVNNDVAGRYFLEILSEGGSYTNLSADLHVIPSKMGKIVAWGSNTNIPGWISGAIAISAGEQHALALLADGTVAAWGNNNYGQIDVPPGLRNVVSISAGDFHSMALTREGRIVGWGNNFNEQLIPPAMVNPKVVRAGESWNAGIDQNGRIHTWGNGFFGQMDVPEVTNAISLSLSSHGLALLEDGKVVGWGYNEYGQATPPPITNAMAVAVGHALSTILLDDNTLIGFGFDYYEDFSLPEGISNVSSMAVAYGRVFANFSDGTVGGWALPSMEYVLPPTWLSNIFQVTAGYQDMALEETDIFILEQPASKTIERTSLCNFNVVAVGIRDLSYQWFKNGTPISGETNSFLTFTNASFQDSGPYHVRVHSPIGYQDSVRANLSVTGTPLIITQPQTQLIRVGEDAVFSINFDDTISTSVQWQKNGTNIIGATNRFLQVTNIEISARGFYRAVLRNVYGAVASFEAELIVLSPPFILEQPKNVAVSIGDYARLSVVAVGAAPLVYQWISNNVPVLNETNATLDIYPAQKSHSGIYSVAISNSLGMLHSSEATLQVFSRAPYIFQQPESKQVQIGRSASFLVLVEAAELSSYQWEFNSLPIQGATSATLFVPTVDPASIGNYRVIVRNSYGVTTSEVAQLNFDLPPNVVVLATNNNFGLLNVPKSLTNAIYISAGHNHNIAVKGDGTVVAWGDNSQGQCDIPANLSNVAAVSAGYQHSLALLSNGTVVGWGATNSFANEAAVPAGLSNVAAIDASTFFSLALLSNGTLRGWGDSASGASTDLAGLTNIVSIASGTEHAICVKSDTTIQMWGLNSFQPVVSNATAIAASDNQFLALKEDGRVVLWNASNASQAFYTGPSNALAISAGSGISPHFLAILENRKLYSWSENGAGLPVPTNVSNVWAISSGFNHHLALVRAPLIILQPKNQGVYYEDTATLQVMVANPIRVTYQWLENGEVIPGATNAFLVTDRVTSLKLFSVRVSNQFGSVLSRTARIDVHEGGPVILQHNSSNTFISGTSNILSVTAGGSTPLRYQWFYNGDLLVGKTNSNLPIESASLADCGIYEVIVSNRFGVASSGEMLVTLSLPEIFLDNENAVTNGSWQRTIGSGSFRGSALLISNHTAAASAVYTAEILLPGPYILTEWHPQLFGSGLRNAQLTVENGSKSNVFVYNQNSPYWVWNTLAQFDLSIGLANFIIENPPQSSPVTITADGFSLRYAPVPPFITKQPVAQIVDFGTTARFEVGVIPSGPVRFQWRKDSVNLPGATNSVLEISDARSSDNGRYSFIAIGPGGVAASIRAALFVTPPRLSFQISTNEIMLSWPTQMTLQVSTNVAGPFFDMPHATVPFAEPLTGSSKFFRLKQLTDATNN